MNMLSLMSVIAIAFFMLDALFRCFVASETYVFSVFPFIPHKLFPIVK
jgi:hypothetical protein